ncbi:MAG TPA: hypothetical protein VNN74_08485 [Candidatus Micrarchaeia archaeon]|nr:hypothetical protein [Candidatus Micrarchaeia archaeon]
MSDQPARARQDLARTPFVVWLWGAPALIAIGASVLVNTNTVSLPVAGALWTVATAWIGLGCAINARHCGRVHCAIDGVLLSLLSVGGLLNLLGIVSFDWNGYWAAFWAIVVASFLVEVCWRRYM